MSFVGSSLNHPVSGLGRGGAVQPINFGSAVIATDIGTATFMFAYVALGQTWTVALNCVGAPDSATFVATTGGTNFGTFIAGNTWGPLQLQGGDQLQVTASGLVPGVTYTMQMQGSAVTGGEPGISTPQAYADSVTTSTEQITLGTGSVYAGTPFTPITIYTQSRWRSLWVAVNDGDIGDDDISVTGDQSGLDYDALLPPYFESYAGSFQRFVLVSGADTSVTLTIDTQAAGYTYWYGADLAEVDTAVYSSDESGIYIQNGVDESGDVVPIVVTSSGGGSSDVTVVNTTSDPVPVTIVGGSGGNTLLTAPFETIETVSSTLSGSLSANLDLSTSSFYLYPTAAAGSYAINITNAPTTAGQACTVVLGVVAGSTAYLPSAITINGTATASSGLPAQASTYNNITSYYQGGSIWQTPAVSTLTYFQVVVMCTATSTYTLLLNETTF